MGDDDIDFTVVTPFGSTLSVTTTSDELSGGNFEESEDVQQIFGPRVKSVYFPLSGGPIGTYTYFVSTFVQTGSLDTWTVKVYEGDVQKVSTTGSGNADFLYEFGTIQSDPTEAPVTPTPAPTVVVFDPTPAPSRLSTPAPTPAPTLGTAAPTSTPLVSCQIPEEECCQDTDCSTDEVCRNRKCVDEGSPRFTLTWNGADDYDLSVTPPIGSTISFLNQFDEESGGRFGENGVQAFPGLHVENVYFPFEGGPIGLYTIEISSFTGLTESPASWNLEVAVNGEVVQSQAGVGISSGDLTYDYQDGSNLRIARSFDVCDVSVGYSCCSDADCPVQGEMCVGRTCIREGELRFTLSWNGEDDLDLIVTKPDGTNLSHYGSPSDPLDGVFEASELIPSLFSTPQVESVYFPANTPLGLYRYKVDSFSRIGVQDDPWTLQVFVDGILVTKPITGRGTSTELSFEYTGTIVPDITTTTNDDTSSPTQAPSSNDLVDDENGVDTVVLPPNGDVGDESNGIGIVDDSNGQQQDDESNTDSNNDDECQVDSDCEVGGMCIFENKCVSTDGPLRFALHWTSTTNVQVQFTVISPDSQTFKSDETLTQHGIGGGGSSGGNVEWEHIDYDDDNGQHHHMVQLVFIARPPTGQYKYILGGHNGQLLPNESWTLKVHKDGKEVRSHNGNSIQMQLFVYGY